MSRRPLTIEHLRDAPIERVVHEAEDRLHGLLGSHRWGEGYGYSPIDVAYALGLALRIYYAAKEREP